MSDSDEVMLSQLAGKRVKDLRGYISCEFGEPTFKVWTVVYDDGTEDWLGGEHDFPYVEIEVPEKFVPKFLEEPDDE
jgi:hypothetical protein